MRNVEYMLRIEASLLNSKDGILRGKLVVLIFYGLEIIDARKRREGCG